MVCFLCVCMCLCISLYVCLCVYPLTPDPQNLQKTTLMLMISRGTEVNLCAKICSILAATFGNNPQDLCTDVHCHYVFEKMWNRRLRMTSNWKNSGINKLNMRLWMQGQFENICSAFFCFSNFCLAFISTIKLII